MYNEINLIVQNYVKNYNKRSLKNRIVDKHDADIVAAYTKTWSENESLYNTALNDLASVDKKLHDYLELAHSCHNVTITEDLCRHTKILVNIHEALCHEEAENLGIGKNARILRKRWRLVRSSIRKDIKLAIKNKIRYAKEWSKPRHTYILPATGEVHNGLWFTIKACISLKLLGVRSVKFEKYKD